MHKHNNVGQKLKLCRQNSKYVPEFKRGAQQDETRRTLKRRRPGSFVVVMTKVAFPCGRTFQFSMPLTVSVPTCTTSEAACVVFEVARPDSRCSPCNASPLHAGRAP